MPSRCIGLLLTALVFCVYVSGQTSQAQPDASSSRIVAYEGGYVWNGTDFSNQPLFVRGGTFVASPTTVDTTIQLDGGYVVPPFGDAHTHNLGAGGISQQVAQDLYVPQGIFYAMDLTNPYSEIDGVQDAFQGPQSIDVAYANGGLTSTGSHPTAAMERIYTDTENVTLENLQLRGDAYWFMDTVADVDATWTEYLAQTPDVVKVYLTYVTRGLKQDECWGLCPEVLQAVVDRAHAASKRVFAHVNTASDVRIALDAGVDALTHLPSGNDGISVDDEPFWLSDDTIARAGRDSVILTPTASLLVEDADPDTLQAEIVRQRTQLRQLYEAGVRIGLGADEWRKTSRYEAFYLHEHTIFANETLLKLWAETTPRAIFPNRKIGHLTPGYEASFLVLDNNPIEDFGAVRQIRLGVKQGHILYEPTDSP
jgi:imidazolonepropionase-like amidohydrolase